LKVNQASLSLPSFAKINLSLQILGKRADGYHEIRTTLQTISLHDDLHFEFRPNGRVSLSCDDPEIPTGNENLVVRAANSVKRRYQVNYSADIRLQKAIPAKGGLGGASSNAAVTLVALARLWEIEASTSELLEIAASLGSDVPFFLTGGFALATGTGSTVSPLPDQEILHLVVIAPNVGISTAQAYARFSAAVLTRIDSDPILSSSQLRQESEDSSLWALPEEFRNDFESVIFDIEPEINRAKEFLLQAGARRALLAGSGSSVFGIFADQEAQQSAIQIIRGEPGWRIFDCVTVSRAEYLGAFGSFGTEFLRSFNSRS
jgi:4-diphosphocytidyl-2-C-methyl-D-erythritol kinase